MGIDLSLSNISQFLRSLKIGKSGEVFIIERSGLLVANSTNQPPYKLVNGKAQRQQIKDIQKPLIHSIFETIIKKFGDLKQINKGQLSEQNTFIQVMPYKDNYGIDWLIIITVPKSDFTAEIKANNNRTILLCFFTFLTSTGIGILIASWINRPILNISKASEAIATGELNEPLLEDIAITEIKTLATSFNQMSQQVKQSMNQVEIALEESTEKYKTLFENLPIGIAITDPTGQIIAINPAAEIILGITDQSSVDMKICPDWLSVTRADGSIIQPNEYTCARALQENKPTSDTEICVVRSDGSIRWLNISAAPIPLENYGVVIAYIDITDGKIAQLNLEQNEARFRRLSENIPGMIYQYVVYADGRDQFTYMSPFGLEIYEIEPEIALNNVNLIWNLVHPEDAPILQQQIMTSARELQQFFSEHRLIMPDG
ncbi:MAG TPA: PAS domain S-box protein, partial [Allocoleopsis sp.]